MDVHCERTWVYQRPVKALTRATLGPRNTIMNSSYERSFVYCAVLVGLTGCKVPAPKIAPLPVLALRLLNDSTRVERNQSVITATVQFVARNISHGRLYGIDTCGRSPEYAVTRRELDRQSQEHWREVFIADCWGGPGSLDPGDSTVFTSVIVEVPGGKPDFAFSDTAETYRFVYFVSKYPLPHHEEERVISPSVILRRPK